jgi:hypothetical protein
MNAALAVAAGTAVTVGAAHSYLGERLIIGPLFRDTDASPWGRGTARAKRTIRVTWHLLTVCFWSTAVILIVLSTAPADARTLVARTISGTFGLLAWVALVTSRGRHPAWLGFMTVAVLAWVGTIQL